MGPLAAGRRVLSEGGVAGLFAGGPERVLRSAPQFGITLALYEGLKAGCEDAVRRGTVQNLIKLPPPRTDTLIIGRPKVTFVVLLKSSYLMTGKP